MGMTVFARIFRFLEGTGEGTGPAGSFEEFAAAYTDRARMWLILLGATRADAEDIVQSSLLALWERRDLVPPTARPRWLRSAISLRLREQWRSQAIRDRLVPRADSEEAALAPVADAGPDVRLGDEEMAAFVRRLVDELPPARRDVVVLYLLEDRPIEEVASMLGTSVSTAWDRWHRARRDLLARLRRARARERFLSGASSFGLLLLLLERIWGRFPRNTRVLMAAVIYILAAAGQVAAPSRPSGRASSSACPPPPPSGAPGERRA